jgi:hypothetical protein
MRPAQPNHRREAPELQGRCADTYLHRGGWRHRLLPSLVRTGRAELDQAVPDHLWTRYYGTTFALDVIPLAYQYTWQLNPATGVAFTAAEANAATLEWGWEAV